MDEGRSVAVDGLGLLFTATGVGAVCSSLLLAMFSSERPRTGIMMLFGVGAGLAIAGFSQSSSFDLSLGLLVIVGLGHTGFMTMSMAMVQYITPPEMRGRVMAIRMLVFGMIPVGTITAGVIAELASPQSALAALALVGAATQLVLWIWMRRAPMDPEPP